MTTPEEAAAILGRKGGKSTSEAKAAAARENGKRGGRPRKAKPLLTAREQAALAVAQRVGWVTYRPDFRYPSYFFGKRFIVDNTRLPGQVFNGLVKKGCLKYVETVNGVYRVYQPVEPTPAAL